MVSDRRRVLRRWLAFSSVGTLGFGVQFAALLVLAGRFEINYLIATALAVELAILHNFLWHQRWTWSDRGTLGARHLLDRLVRFNAGTALTSFGGNLSLMWVFVSLFDIHYAAANVVAVLRRRRRRTLTRNLSATARETRLASSSARSSARTRRCRRQRPPSARRRTGATR